MKRFKLLLVALVLMIVPFFSVDAAQKVNVYLFRGEGCPHCAEAEKFFEALSKDAEYSNYYELVDYEVWYDEDNADLMDEVAEELNTKADGVPFMVIGEKYFSGYTSSMDTQLKEQIKYSYNSSNYVDVVKKVQDNNITEDDDDEEEVEEKTSDRSLISSKDADDDLTIGFDSDDLEEFDGLFKQVFFMFAEVFTAFGIGTLIAILFIAFPFVIFGIIVKWILFKKAGRHGWEAIIPVYNRWVLYEISGYPGYYMFFIFIPCVGYIIDFVFTIMAAISISKKFKQDPAYAILIILLPLIGYAVLAFGSSEYDDSLGEQKNKKN